MATIEVDLIELWQAYPNGNRDEFVRFVAQVSDLAEDEVCFCRDCADPYHVDDTYQVMHDERACDSCYADNYYVQCAGCGVGHRNDEMTTTLYDTEVCSACIDAAYSWCEHCEGYYVHGDDDHYHTGCDCCSPQLSFTIRNDGNDPLPNDTRVTVQLPAGIISPEGLREIYYAVRDHAYEGDEYLNVRRLSNDLEVLGDKWQAKDGNYTKRLSRHAYKTYGLKLSPDLISAVGNIASAHSSAVSFDIETTRDLNRRAEDFYHGGSCWWGSYSESRCALKTNGGFGIRSFDTQKGHVSGRVWVMPLKRAESPDDPAHALVPTFDTMDAVAFVTFNGYGDLQGYTPARLLSHMLGMTYRKISFEASPMYVNSGGYLVAPEDIAKVYTDGRLYMSLSEHSNLFYDESKEKVHA